MGWGVDIGKFKKHTTMVTSGGIKTGVYCLRIVGKLHTGVTFRRLQNHDTND